MRLKELEKYSPITIQMHDNPDADAIASGYALLKYFLSKKIDTELVYSGRYQIKKSNLKLFIEKLQIPITYLEQDKKYRPGLLLTVDCQYGAGNVTHMDADYVAVIDHHQIEINDQQIPFCEIQTQVGSCSTIVWKMLKDEGYQVEQDIEMGTALFYGLYMDTNQFSEIGSPLDMDMQDDLNYDKGFIMQLKNSNLSLDELEIAGIALIGYLYSEEYHYAVIQTKPCDPNLLGLISDFLLQVDCVNTCVVYNETADGFKFSVRSCIKEVRANEMAQYLTEDIGTGGGHAEKAGGFISRELYNEKQRGIHSEYFMKFRMAEYFESFEIIDANKDHINIDNMMPYSKRKTPEGYVKLSELFPQGTPIIVRTFDGDTNIRVDENKYMMIGLKGEAYSIEKDRFETLYQETKDRFDMDTEYMPKIKNKLSGNFEKLLQFARICYINEGTVFYARQLKKAVKIFSKRNNDSYLQGKIGDYLVVNENDLQDIYVVENEIFTKIYMPIEG